MATEKEKTQWYFQRYVGGHLPAAGEMVVFDRFLVQPRRGGAGDGLLYPEQVEEFFRSVPEIREEVDPLRH